MRDSHLIHAREHVRVAVEPDGDRRMPKALADNRGWDALGQDEGRMGVAEVLKSDVFRPHLLLQLLKKGPYVLGRSGKPARG